MERIALNGVWNMAGNGYHCFGTVPGSVYCFLLENELRDDHLCMDRI